MRYLYQELSFSIFDETESVNHSGGKTELPISLSSATRPPSRSSRRASSGEPGRAMFSNKADLFAKGRGRARPHYSYI